MDDASRLFYRLLCDSTTQQHSPARCFKTLRLRIPGAPRCRSVIVYISILPAHRSTDSSSILLMNFISHCLLWSTAVAYSLVSFAAKDIRLRAYYTLLSTPPPSRAALLRTRAPFYHSYAFAAFTAHTYTRGWFPV